MLTNMCCGLLGADPSVALGGQALSIMREDSSCVWEAQGSARAELEGVRPPETVIQIANSPPCRLLTGTGARPVVLQSAPMCSYDSLHDVGPILGQRACTVWLPWRSFFATPPQHLPNIQFKLNGSNPEHVATRVRARYGHGFAKRRME